MRINSIQALRALAALSVAAVHVLNEAIPLDPGGTIAAWHAALPWEAGVDLFFVISGFIMVHASQRLFGQPGAPWRFLGHRLARIVPLYWAMTAVFLAVALAAGGSVNTEVSGPAQVAASLAFIPWPRPGGAIQPVYSLGWTLNYEMLFYAVFALFIGLPQRVALACVAAALLVMTACHGQVAAQPQMAFWTDPIIAEFVFGMAVALLRQAGVVLRPGIRAGLALLAVTALVWLHAAAPGLATPLRAGLPVALLLAAAALGPDPAWLPLLLLGDASYALYLVHPFPMRALGIAWRRLHLTGLAAATAYCVISLAVAVAMAIALHLWLERPATRVLRGLAPATRAGRSPPPG